VETILEHPRPTTLRQLQRFLRMKGYCRQWISEYAVRAQSLYDMVKEAEGDKISWTDNADKDFETQKQALSSAPALGLPNYDLHFNLFVHERGGFAQAVLTQEHGGKNRPIAYYISHLDPVAAAYPGCLRAVAATQYAVTATATLVLGSPLTVKVPHDVAALIRQNKTQHISAAWAVQHDLVLLQATNIVIERCLPLNPASLMPTSDEGEAHVCERVLVEETKARHDLQEAPIENAELELFVDGAATKNQ